MEPPVPVWGENMTSLEGNVYVPSHNHYMLKAGENVEHADSVAKYFSVFHDAINPLFGMYRSVCLVWPE